MNKNFIELLSILSEAFWHITTTFDHSIAYLLVKNSHQTEEKLARRAHTLSTYPDPATFRRAGWVFDRFFLKGASRDRFRFKASFYFPKKLESGIFAPRTCTT